MSRRSPLHIAVLAGDGVGVEVMAECLELLRHLQAVDSGLSLDFETLEGGAAHYSKTGVALPDETMDRARKADAILFGAMGLPHIRYPDGREIAPQLDIRERLELYAGVRPVRSIPGLVPVLSDRRAATIDFVLVRESTEGLFARRLDCVRTGDWMAADVLQVTRPATARVVEFAFRLAGKRRRNIPPRVTCVDKANVLGSFAFFRKVFDEVAERRQGVATADHMYVDAAALNMLRRPWDFDVLVTENMFGDILSDLGAGLLGGMGFAPSADIGDRHAMFQPCHGSAPDIAGTGAANPIGMFLSAAMMLEWLAERRPDAACERGAERIRAAVDRSFASGALRPIELGGKDDLAAVTAAIIGEIDRAL
jgi:3-isopropylmalate dehydrogenase